MSTSPSPTKVPRKRSINPWAILAIAAAAFAVCAPVLFPGRSGSGADTSPHGDRNQYHPRALCKHMREVSTGAPVTDDPVSRQALAGCVRHLEEMRQRHSDQGWHRIRSCIRSAKTSGELLACQQGK